jgi:hypothetical protein
VIEWRVGEAAPDAIDGVAELLGAVFPRAPHLDRARLAWDYLENPHGRSMLARAFAGGALVATLAGRRMRATLGGASAHGVLVHHAATHPDFRRRGLLAQAIEGLAAARTSRAHRSPSRS